MSVKAYRVTQLRFLPTSTFDLWHHPVLVDFLDHEYNLLATLDDDSCGLTEVSIEVLERALAELPLDDNTREALDKDIQACRKDGYVQYYCY